MEENTNKAHELFLALEALGEGGSAKVQKFLQKQGYTMHSINAAGGVIPVMLDMIPLIYPTVEDLVEAIKSSN